ncbi:MAG: lon [Chthoniobacteraceae bacterium]|nr:lon [Chthoniobacteraceae bacterium]
MLEEADPHSPFGTNSPTLVKDFPSPELPAPFILHIVPVCGLVLFPGMIAPLMLGAEVTKGLLSEALAENQTVGVLAQRNQTVKEPGESDLFSIGCMAQIMRLVPQADGGMLLLVEGMQRFALRKMLPLKSGFDAEIEILTPRTPPGSDKQWETAIHTLRASALKLLEMMPEVPEEARATIASIHDGEQLTDLLATNLPIEVEQKQILLEELDVAARLHGVQGHITHQLGIVQIQQTLLQEVQTQFSEAQRRAYLHEQLRAIHRQLGDDDPDKQTVQLREQLINAGLSAETMDLAERELRRLAFVPPASPEYCVIVSYLETLAGLPWQKVSTDTLDLDQAQRILDRDHFNLVQVKCRLIEYLAVRKLNPGARGSILCFLGPPGVGKTSLGQSVADALGRKFARVSLGGIRDEAEIRGHRRSYIGSMPGRMIQELRRTGTRNPVFMLDEVDKIGADFRGDPASALLEVLDPWQNQAFVDRYLDVPFDFSKVIFIATANSLDPIPAPLRDRMEILELPGYTEREKLAIAQQFLLPRQLIENGLSPETCFWEPGVLQRIISDYTHEAGVRELERQIAAVCRRIASQIARGQCRQGRIAEPLLSRILGPAKFVREQRLKADIPGIATALAYTPMGGEILHVEATRYFGKGNIKLTGQLGAIMRESVETAISLLRSRAATLGINAQAFIQNDIHVHLPCGAVPKDGPSAGIAMFTALASLFTNTAVHADLAMTGEITLRGSVLPVSGLKEKSLAAMRAGIRRVLIPKLNEKDLAEVPEEVREYLIFTPVESVDEVLRLALHEHSGF